MDIRIGIQKASDMVIEEIKKMSIECKNNKQITEVATISSNGDQEIGKLISTLFEKVGSKGAITVEEGRTINHEIDIVEGLKFDRGYMSPYFVTNQKTNIVELENPMILLSSQKVTNIQHVLKFLEQAISEGKPIVIIAEDVENEPLSTLILNKLKGSIKVCCVKAPAFGDNRKNLMQDIAILLGA